MTETSAASAVQVGVADTSHSVENVIVTVAAAEPDLPPDVPPTSEQSDAVSRTEAVATPVEVTSSPAESIRSTPVPQASPPRGPHVSAGKKGREPIVLGSRSLAQWVRLMVAIVVGVIVAAAIIVLAARGVTTLPGVPEFLQRYPGSYALPDSVEPGFPAWARWAHYLNFFFMVLIVRTGLIVRYQRKPPAFYTPKRGGKKVSIYLWLHTGLDLLWLLNGLVFVVLLFATGAWPRIVPTSWAVFPNALSALLQYLTLQWPVENGWVNYNSLQQLMYFAVVFIAAPLAAITGIRMSSWWPKNSPRLDRIYPAPLARAIHFPTMLFFVLFVIIHVFLVFATGALQNLNHMFAGTDEISWTGFWIFAAGLAVVVAVWLLVRPLVLAPIANVFGRVSNR
ncbi:cytochrome b/b6 domain-containing protein [Diaminobutyricibacter sp. McL0618]|uniref:cytochrome b/b6 domain-containing protein n=1 Tax=Leifsonia sp. McL0618 TaxID=3415677 RepID=UPI003CF2FF07